VTLVLSSGMPASSAAFSWMVKDEGRYRVFADQARPRPLSVRPVFWQNGPRPSSAINPTTRAA
jgi:hypothetical protein